MEPRGPVEEVDVAAVVAEQVAQHAPGTTVAGPDSGGVQVIRVSLAVDAFRELLAALSATLGRGTRLRLDYNGGVLSLDVTGEHHGADGIDALRRAAAAMGGEVVPDPPAAQPFSVRIPAGLSEWD